MPTLDPRVDVYIAKQPESHQATLRTLRRAFHVGCPSVSETIKWGVPFFEYHGPLGSIAAFKRHVSWGFWRAKALEDPEGLFVGDAKGQMCAVRFSDAHPCPSQKVLAAYVRRAATHNRKHPGGKPRVAPPAKAPRAPADLAQALRAVPEAAAHWKRLTAAQRRDYVTWIQGAKQAPTRERRIATAVTWVAEGKQRNWKYAR